MKALVLDFGGVISRTLFETHALTERSLGLAAGTLAWRGPFDAAGDEPWRRMQAGVISEREGKKADAERLYRRVLAREPVKNAAGAVQADPLREVARENLDNLRAGGGSAQ